ncbi:MAG: hypothetical protein ACUVXB_03825 [Bryobacteraceae bacterium]
MASQPEAFHTTAAEPKAAAGYPRGGGPDPYRLRPLPFEEIYLFRKRIDNSGVVRLPDASNRRRCLRSLFSVGFLIVALWAAYFPTLYATNAGYKLSRLKADRERMLAAIASTVAREAQLRSPVRLRETAPSLDLSEPAPSELVFLNPPGQKEELAWHPGAK